MLNDEKRSTGRGRAKFFLLSKLKVTSLGFMAGLSFTFSLTYIGRAIMGLKEAFAVRFIEFYASWVDDYLTCAETYSDSRPEMPDW
jgi:hypothetical protein